MKPEITQKLYMLGTMAFVIIVVAGIVHFTSYVPKVGNALQLKAPKDRILFNQTIKDEKGDDIVQYLYASGVEVLQTTYQGISEDLSKRTKNAQFFDKGNGEMIGRFYSGEPFYKEGDKWFQTETATTTIKAFEEQMKLTSLDKIREFFEKKVYAACGDSGGICYSGSGDGYVNYNDAASWDTAHDAATGTSAADDVAFSMVDSYESGVYFGIYRAFFPTDTSALPDNAVVTDATFDVYGVLKTNTDDDGYDYINIVQTDQPDPTNLTTADFNNCGATDNPAQGATAIDIGVIATSAYNTWTLNDTGKGWISVDSYTMLGMRTGHDIQDHPQANETEDKFFHEPSEEAGKGPYLTITYTIGGGAEETHPANIIWFGED